jgi:hypothetical protein
MEDIMAGPKDSDTQDTPILITAMEGNPFNSTDIMNGNLGVVAATSKNLHYKDGNQGVIDELRKKAKGRGATHITHFKILINDGEYIASGNAWKKPNK